VISSRSTIASIGGAAGAARSTALAITPRAQPATSSRQVRVSLGLGLRVREPANRSVNDIGRAGSSSVRPASVRPASVRPASVRPASVRPASTRPASMRPSVRAASL